MPGKPQQHSITLQISSEPRNCQHPSRWETWRHHMQKLSLVLSMRKWGWRADPEARTAAVAALLQCPSKPHQWWLCWFLIALISISQPGRQEALERATRFICCSERRNQHIISTLEKAQRPTWTWWDGKGHSWRTLQSRKAPRGQRAAGLSHWWLKDLNQLHRLYG